MIDEQLGTDPGGDASTPRRNRGFWLVAATMAVASIVVLVAIFANAGLKDTIAHAQYTLRTAQAQAERVAVETGSFDEADAGGLAARLPELAFVGPDEPSSELDEVSVTAGESSWAAAVRARPGACFFLRIGVDGDVTYGSGTDCTGREAARSALDDAW